jgi:hypothetical protein
MDFGARVQAKNQLALGLGVKNHWRFEARDKDGNVKWIEEFDNLTTTQGLNDILTKYFTGSGYTAAWYCRLVDNVGFGAFAAADTAAKVTTSTPSGGTNNWQENVGYSNATSPAIVFGTASAGSISNSASPAVFNINATVTIYGGFATSTDTPGGTTGVLYGEGAFSATRSLLNGDTLTVTVTMTAAST